MSVVPEGTGSTAKAQSDHEIAAHVEKTGVPRAFLSTTEQHHLGTFTKV